MRWRLHIAWLVVILAWPVAAAGHDVGPEKLGTIHFDVPGDAATREHVTRGVKYLHHMMYVEADREFTAALAADPDCGFAYWGRAMAIVHPLWPDVPDAGDLARGADLIGQGLARPLRTERERAYLGAMGAFFHDPAAPSLPARLQAADTAWAQVAQQFPADQDAAAFAALYHLAPARFLAKDKSHRRQFEAVTALDKILAQVPDHPGALHYKIHALDFPLLAGRALEVCDTYGEIAPDVPHALHMPTHIFTRQGEWAKSIDYNERSVAAARDLMQRDGATNSHLPHGLDYLAYAYLQQGRYQKAESIRQEVLAAKAPFQKAGRPAMAFAFAAIPARLALERHDWAAAAQLKLRQPISFPWSDSFVYCDAITCFARALGAERSGDAKQALIELTFLEEVQSQIHEVLPGSYWDAQALVQVTTIHAWRTLRHGNPDAAVAQMRDAVREEATMDKEAVTPGEVLPAGELLGEMLIEVGRPAEALAAFVTQLEISPNRLNGLYGAGHAAELAGDNAQAAAYFQKVLAVAAHADSPNAQIQHASEFLASHRLSADTGDSPRASQVARKD